MAKIDDHIATYLQAIEIEGKSAKTIASYANTLADFRTIGCRLGFPESPEEYRVPHVYAFLGTAEQRRVSCIPASPPPRGEGLLLLAAADGRD